MSLPAPVTVTDVPDELVVPLMAGEPMSPGVHSDGDCAAVDDANHNTATTVRSDRKTELRW
jgi:hypothetical protein